MSRDQFVFNKISDVQSFLLGLNDEAQNRDVAAFSALSRNSIDGLLRETHGTRSSTSTHGKEWAIYNYQDTIFSDDYLYLHTRDPTTHAINRQVPRDTWFRLPETLDDRVDSFFAELTRMNFPRKAIEADVSQRRDGSAFLYVIASGNDPSQPIQREDTISGFQVIPMARVNDDDVVLDDTGDPLLQQHGIRSLTIDGDPSIAEEEITPGPDDIFNDRMFSSDTEIHGSRLILFKEDWETDFWVGRPKIEPIYDDLWNLRDIVWAQTMAQFEGDPISVEISDDATFGLSPEAESLIQEEIEEYITGLGQVFSPVEGISIKRVGPQDLNDPTPALRMIVSRISSATEFPVGMLMAMSRGSEQVTDQDILTYASEIDIRRDSFSLPILQHMLLLGKWTRMVQQRAELPHVLYWPNLRTLSPREKAYVNRTNALALDIALTWRRKLPREIAREFPPDESAPPPAEAEPEDDRTDDFDLKRRLTRMESMLFELSERLTDKEEVDL